MPLHNLVYAQTKTTSLCYPQKVALQSALLIRLRCPIIKLSLLPDSHQYGMNPNFPRFFPKLPKVQIV